LRDERGIMSSGHSLVFETERLVARTATEQDVDLFYALCTSPRQTIPSINAGRRSSSVSSARLCAGFFFLNAGEGEILDIDSGHNGKGAIIVGDDLPLPGDGLHIGERP